MHWPVILCNGEMVKGNEVNCLSGALNDLIVSQVVFQGFRENPFRKILITKHVRTFANFAEWQP